MQNLVSEATMKNWNRLGVGENEKEKRLSTRANKRLSGKNIIPVEYFKNKENIRHLEHIADFIMDKNLSTETIIYNLALNILIKNKLVEINNSDITSKNNNIIKVLKEFSSNIEPSVLNIETPDDEEDFLGITYQYLQKEGDKNVKGSYYTPQNIIKKAIENLKSEDTYLDPCCGSGSFILQAANIIKNPQNIYGCDMDRIACFIAKINLIIKFKNIDFTPNIYNINFLDDKKVFENVYFDVIATNPPWGAFTEENYRQNFPFIKSGESFSYFIAKTKGMLKKDGECSFILPESILNVKVHKDIRKFILDNFSIQRIENMGKIFSGVLSDVIMLQMNFNNNRQIELISNGERFNIDQKYYNTNDNYNFSFIDGKDAKLLKKLYSKAYETLTSSKWGLGIVTGNNGKYLQQNKTAENEPIYTGKEIGRYILKAPQNYITFDRNNFQQVAKDEVYRASEKLIYKFISKKLVFAYDDKKSLVLNSANILIPRLQTHTAKTALAFLNSKVFEYIYKKKFNELKILKNNLCALPFLTLTQEQREKLDNLVNNYLENINEEILSKIDDIIFRFFNLTQEEIILINDFCK